MSVLCTKLERKGKEACEPFSAKPQPPNSPGQRSVWSFSISLSSADDETVAPEGPVTDGNQSSWRAGKCLCGMGRGGGVGAESPSPLLSFKAACSHHTVLQTQPTALLGSKLKEAVRGQMHLVLPQASHQESNSEPCNTDPGAGAVSSSGEQEVAGKSKLGICLLHKAQQRNCQVKKA